MLSKFENQFSENRDVPKAKTVARKIPSPRLDIPFCVFSFGEKYEINKQPIRIWTQFMSVKMSLEMAVTSVIVSTIDVYKIHPHNCASPMTRLEDPVIVDIWFTTPEGIKIGLGVSNFYQGERIWRWSHQIQALVVERDIGLEYPICFDPEGQGKVRKKEERRKKKVQLSIDVVTLTGVSK